MTKKLTEQNMASIGNQIYRLTDICLDIQKKMVKTDLQEEEMKELQDAYGCYKRAITMDVIKIIKHVEAVTGLITHDNINDFFPQFFKDSQHANQH